MAAKALNITTPIGRLVGGSLYEPKTTDYDGNPLKIKTGPNAGKDRVEFSFAVAIAKNPGETHWSQHPFFAPIWAYGHAAFTGGEAQHPTFAWKIQDGDSAIPNKRQKKNSEREGFPGHWIIWFSGGQAPRVYNANGTQQIMEKDAVKPGYYVQVFGNVGDNKPSASPGLYVNHSYVALSAYGEEIVFGPDVSAAGFGQGVALPPGASAAPLAGAVPAAVGTPPPPPGALPPPLIPNLAPPPPVAALVPPPVVAPVKQMTAKANGATYESMIAAGWNEQQLIDNGYMVGVPPAPLTVGSATPPAPPAPTVVAPPPLPVTPDPSLLAVPAPKQLTAKANGASYESMIAGGWSDIMLIQHGYMTA